MEGIAIQLDAVRKKYHNNTALDGITVNLHENCIIGLIGANGSGKTTLMKICAGLEEKSSGKVLVCGADITKDICASEEVIYSMHDLPVGKLYRISELLKFYNTAYPHFDLAFCKKMLEIFGISLKKTCRTLSQGQKSLVHFSCATATRCRVTLLDEPFIGIDIVNRELVYEILLRDFMEHPRAIIISSHNLSEIEGILSEMLLLHHGRIVFYQEMDAVREMLFRADGSREEIQGFIEGKETVCAREKEVGFQCQKTCRYSFEAVQEAISGSYNILGDGRLSMYPGTVASRFCARLCSDYLVFLGATVVYGGFYGINSLILHVFARKEIYLDVRNTFSWNYLGAEMLQMFCACLFMYSLLVLIYSFFTKIGIVFASVFTVAVIIMANVLIYIKKLISGGMKNIFSWIKTPRKTFFSSILILNRAKK